MRDSNALMVAFRASPRDAKARHKKPASLGAFYDYHNGNTSLLVWHATAAGFDAPVGQWNSGAGNYDANRIDLL